MIRCLAALPIAYWAALPLARQRVAAVAFAGAGIALLGTISLVSHSRTTGLRGFLSDFGRRDVTTCPRSARAAC